MKKQFIIYIVLLFAIVSGCRTIKESDYHKENYYQSPILPNLQAEVDVDNLKEKISYGKYKVSGYYYGFLTAPKNSDSLQIVIYDKDFDEKDHLMNPEKYHTKATFVPEMRINDVIKFFSVETYNNIVDTNTSSKGNIILELVSFKDKGDGGLLFVNIWTLCIPTLLGFPLNRIYTTLEIKLSITDNDNNIINSFNAEGKGTAYNALYWGYGKDASRKSTINALNNAFSKIKEQIEENKIDINKRLNNLD